MAPRYVGRFHIYTQRYNRIADLAEICRRFRRLKRSATAVFRDFDRQMPAAIPWQEINVHFRHAVYVQELLRRRLRPDIGKL